jgi:hypothetical protein
MYHFLIKTLVFFSQLFVCGFLSDNPQRMKRFARGRTQFMITSLTSYFTRIVVGDCRVGNIYQENYIYKQPYSATITQMSYYF